MVNEIICYIHKGKIPQSDWFHGISPLGCSKTFYICGHCLLKNYKGIEDFDKQIKGMFGKKTRKSKKILPKVNENMELILSSEGKVKDAIKECEGKHIQQIAYSSYHDAFTQVCFGCKKIRTSLKKEDLNS